MNLTLERKESLEKTYQYYLHHEALLKMKEIPAHIGSNVYVHTFKVVKQVMKRAIKSRKELDLENLLLAAIFHDYYLYNWRTTKDRPHPHGKYHPTIAADNAKRRAVRPLGGVRGRGIAARRPRGRRVAG